MPQRKIAYDWWDIVPAGQGTVVRTNVGETASDKGTALPTGGSLSIGTGLLPRTTAAQLERSVAVKGRQGEGTRATGDKGEALEPERRKSIRRTTTGWQPRPSNFHKSPGSAGPSKVKSTTKAS